MDDDDSRFVGPAKAIRSRTSLVATTPRSELEPQQTSNEHAQYVAAVAPRPGLDRSGRYVITDVPLAGMICAAAAVCIGATGLVYTRLSEDIEKATPKIDNLLAKLNDHTAELRSIQTLLEERDKHYKERLAELQQAVHELQSRDRTEPQPSRRPRGN
jgi:hypothetical protein